MPDDTNKSFSRRVKEEIFRASPVDKCCIMSRLRGIILFGSCTVTTDELRLVTGNRDVVGCFAELLRNLGLEAAVTQSRENGKYTADIRDSVKILQLLYDMGMITSDNKLLRRADDIEKICCKREFLCGAFLGAGTLSDPFKNYSLEISAPTRELCSDIINIFSELGFNMHSSARKNKYVVYVKSSKVIEDILAFFGACRSQMDIINIEIEKEIRNDANRNGNSETSNLSRTINACVEQIRAIQHIRDTVGLDTLPDDLREISLLRLKHKDYSLTELGKTMDPPLTKSGVNHRIKKILEIAEKTT